MYHKKEKDDIKENLQSLLETASEIKSITKTRFISELENNKKKSEKAHVKNILNYVFSDLDGDDVEHLRERLRERVEEAQSLVEKGEEIIIKNILKKARHTHTVLVDGKRKIHDALIKTAKYRKIKINFVNSIDKNRHHIDLALVHVDGIDHHNNIFTNKSSRELIEKANKSNIPVYCYTHSLNFMNFDGNKYVVKPPQVKSVISDIGIFEPEMFVQELRLKCPWLF